MNDIIRKYKDKPINLQSSRKLVRTTYIIYCIIVIMIIGIIISIVKTNARYENVWKSLILVTVIFLFNLYFIDWSVKTSNNILLVRKWIFQYKIPFKDLINIQEDWGLDEDFWKYEFIRIKYRKGKKIKNLRMDYLIKSPFLNFEYVKKSEIKELIHVFFIAGELIENRKESNVLLPEYKNIRTEQEEKEIDDWLNKRKNNEEKIIWILISILVIIFMVFLWYIFKNS